MEFKIILCIIGLSQIIFYYCECEVISVETNQQENNLKVLSDNVTDRKNELLSHRIGLLRIRPPRIRHHPGHNRYRSRRRRRRRRCTPRRPKSRRPVRRPLYAIYQRRNSNVGVGQNQDSYTNFQPQQKFYDHSRYPTVRQPYQFYNNYQLTRQQKHVNEHQIKMLPTFQKDPMEDEEQQSSHKHFHFIRTKNQQQQPIPQRQPVWKIMEQMNEPKPGQILYPPSTPRFLPIPIQMEPNNYKKYEDKQHEETVRLTNMMRNIRNFTVPVPVPFYEHEAITMIPISDNYRSHSNLQYQQITSSTTTVRPPINFVYSSSPPLSKTTAFHVYRQPYNYESPQPSEEEIIKPVYEEEPISDHDNHNNNNNNNVNNFMLPKYYYPLRVSKKSKLKNDHHKNNIKLIETTKNPLTYNYIVETLTTGSTLQPSSPLSTTAPQSIVTSESNLQSKLEIINKNQEDVTKLYNSGPAVIIVTPVPNVNLTKYYDNHGDDYEYFKRTEDRNQSIFTLSSLMNKTSQQQSQSLPFNCRQEYNKMNSFEQKSQNYNKSCNTLQTNLTSSIPSSSSSSSIYLKQSENHNYNTGGNSRNNSTLKTILPTTPSTTSTTTTTTRRPTSTRKFPKKIRTTTTTIRPSQENVKVRKKIQSTLKDGLSPEIEDFLKIESNSKLMTHHREGQKETVDETKQQNSFKSDVFVNVDVVEEIDQNKNLPTMINNRDVIYSLKEQENQQQNYHNHHHHREQQQKHEQHNVPTNKKPLQLQLLEHQNREDGELKNDDEKLDQHFNNFNYPTNRIESDVNFVDNHPLYYSNGVENRLDVNGLKVVKVEPNLDWYIMLEKRKHPQTLEKDKKWSSVIRQPQMINF